MTDVFDVVFTDVQPQEQRKQKPSPKANPNLDLNVTRHGAVPWQNQSDQGP